MAFDKNIVNTIKNLNTDSFLNIIYNSFISPVLTFFFVRSFTFINMNLYRMVI